MLTNVSDEKRTQLAHKLATRIMEHKGARNPIPKNEPHLHMANSGIFIEAETVIHDIDASGNPVAIPHNFTDAFDNLSDAMAAAQALYSEDGGEFQGVEFRFYDVNGRPVGPAH